MSAVFWGGLGGADVHEPVHLTAVGVDDLTLEGAGQMQCQGALPHGRGAQNHDKRRLAHKLSGTGLHPGRNSGNLYELVGTQAGATDQGPVDSLLPNELLYVLGVEAASVKKGYICCNALPVQVEEGPQNDAPP